MRARTKWDGANGSQKRSNEGNEDERTNKITHAINGCAIRVHDVLGPGLFENIYNECLQYELKEEGLSFEVNRAAPVIYKGVRLKSTYYLSKYKACTEGSEPTEPGNEETEPTNFNGKPMCFRFSSIASLLRLRDPLSPSPSKHAQQTPIERRL